jgi:uncharacterized membrane protein
MKEQRLNGLSDGIFAIVMTLLAIELRVPLLTISNPTSVQLLEALSHVVPIFVSFVLSFALLFTYWRSHHFLTSVYAKTLSVGLANYNALFFLFITTVPFSAHLLGVYSHTPLSILIYGGNIIAIGLVLLLMRMHIENSPKIQTVELPISEWRSGYIRILMPIFSAAVAMVVSIFDTQLSIALFIFAILFNLIPTSSNVIYFFLDLLFVDNGDTMVNSRYDPTININKKEHLRKKKHSIHQNMRRVFLGPKVNKKTKTDDTKQETILE